MKKRMLKFDAGLCVLVHDHPTIPLITKYIYECKEGQVIKVYHPMFTWEFYKLKGNEFDVKVFEPIEAPEEAPKYFDWLRQMAEDTNPPLSNNPRRNTTARNNTTVQNNTIYGSSTVINWSTSQGIFYGNTVHSYSPYTYHDDNDDDF